MWCFAHIHRLDDHPSPGTITLAPLHDPVPTALWPALDAGILPSDSAVADLVARVRSILG